MQTADFFADQQVSQLVKYNFQIMKSNKGILTILNNFSEFILQSRITPSEAFKKHFASLKTQLQLLRSQQLPSTELIHFLVQQHSYNLKNKLMKFLKTESVGRFAIMIKFIITNKSTFRTQVAEVWKLTVVSLKQKQVLRESRAHELLYLVGRLFERLDSKEYFCEIIKNRQIMRKYLVDFSIEIGQEIIQTLPLNQLRKATFNSASIDNSRQLQIQCYTNSKLSLPTVPNKEIKHANSPSSQEQLKSSLEATRSGSLEGEQLTIRKMLIQQNILQFYNIEHDITILSSDSDSGCHKSMTNSMKHDSFQQYQLLIEERDEDQAFLQDNKENFSNWQLSLLYNFN